jgi:UDP-4-amino-4,6-dideoxy-N-acetyl-beta-L-altrosamine transaminase
MIPYGKQQISEQDVAAVIEVLHSDWLTQGPKVPEFEHNIAQYCQADYAVAVNSATSALHIACLALQVGPGDRVWTSPNSFVASANCALYCGASVDFVDIDLQTGNLCVQALEHKLQQAKQNGTLPKVVIPVHFAGQSCPMETIARLAKLYGFAVIEDASHAIGASYQQRPVGDCRYSDICIFSFHPVKIITSAEGGMALTNSPQLARTMQRLRSHGITSVETEMTEPSHGPWYYQQIGLGFNYRMTDLQAALGLSQFTELTRFVESRNALARRYNELCQHIPQLEPLKVQSDCLSSYHLYVVLLQQANRPVQSQLITKLRQLGIMAHLHYIPIHLQPYYQQLGFQAGQFPQAENYYQRAITLPLYPGLTAAEQDLIIESLQACLLAATEQA